MGTKPRKNKYIPNLAEFYFEPDFDWSIDEARDLFTNSATDAVDIIRYEDCVSGMQHLPPASIDLIIADPPFGLDFSGKEALYNRNANLVVTGYSEINSQDYASFSHRWIAELPRILKDHGSAYIFSGWTNLAPILEAINSSGLILRNHLIWVYNFAVFTKKKFASSHYHILYVVKNEKKCFFNRIQHYETDVWIIPRNYAPGQEKNGTKLPMDLVRKCINYSSRPGDLVLDPFTGNATTQSAAKGEFRHYLGFELNEQLRSIINANINAIQPGEYYRPYKERQPGLEELKRKYPQSYKKYLESEKVNEK
jgi:site-specific DNA-methyltransferase (adenine-specific)